MEPAAILEAAHVEVARMRAAVARSHPEAEVRMQAAQFGRLAELIAALVALAEHPDPGAPGDPRYWVPLAHYARLKARFEAQPPVATAPVDDLGLAALEQAVARAA